MPSITAAQAILESGWGSSRLSQEANNLFGIKGRYNGQYVLMPTLEWSGGSWVTVNAEFRKYPDWATSVEDNGNFFLIILGTITCWGLRITKKWHSYYSKMDMRLILIMPAK